MFVVRPHIGWETPRALAKMLGCETRYYPNKENPRRFDWKTDFLMTPVHPDLLDNAPPEYKYTHHFGTRNKYGQRKILEEFVPIPSAANSKERAQSLLGERFVVRPLRHARGADYRVTSDRLDFIPGTEYIQELYPKRREYRVIFVFGKQLIVLRKKPNEGVSFDEPWGLNATYQTVYDIPACYLSGTDCFSRLPTVPAIKGSHILAADIMYNPDAEKKWVVLELNFCPALEWAPHREKVVEAIRART